MTVLFNIYEFITKMQTLIGNGAEVRLSAHDRMFVIRVDWWKDDFHAQRSFDDIELQQVVEEGILLDWFVNYCRNAYDRKKAAEQ